MDCEDLTVGTGMLQDYEFVEECVEEVLSEESDDDLFETREPKKKKRKSTYKFPISKQTSDKIYAKAGTSVHSSDGIMIVEPYPVVFQPTITELIEEVRVEMKLPYEFNDIQLQALHAIGNLKDCIVNAPCGAGKMNIFFAGTLLLRKVKNMAQGIGVILEPLVAISEEKRKKNPPVAVCFIDMNGECNVSDGIVNISENMLDSILKGQIVSIFISAEALLSVRGIEMLKSWRHNLLLAAVDEAQLFGEDQWGSTKFRIDMSRAPGTG